MGYGFKKVKEIIKELNMPNLNISEFSELKLENKSLIFKVSIKKWIKL